MDVVPELVYLAYNFNNHGYEEWTPRVDLNLESIEVQKQARAERVKKGGAPVPENRKKFLPFFFSVDPVPERNRPEKVEAERSILHIADRLPPNELCQQSQEASIRAFGKDCTAVLDEIIAVATTGKAEVISAAEDLFETVRRLQTNDDGELKVKLDLEIVDSMRESIVRTAPIWLKPMIKTHHALALAIRAAGGLARSILLELARWLRWWSPKRIQEAIDDIKGKTYSAKTVGNLLQSWAARQGDARVNPKWKESETWEREAEEILRRFNTEERTNLQATDWDKLAAEFWKKAPKGKATVVMVGTLLVGLGVAAWVVVEPATGAVAGKLLAGQAVLGVTIGELFACLGLGGLAGTVAGGVLKKGLETKIGRQQISNFFGIAADRLGLPPEIPQKFTGDFPPRTIEVLPNENAYGRCERHWQIANPIDKNVAVIRTHLRSLQS